MVMAAPIFIGLVQWFSTFYGLWFLFPKTLNTCGPLLRILFQKTSAKLKKKKSSLKTVSDFFIFIPKNKLRLKKVVSKGFCSWASFEKLWVSNF